MISIKTLGNGVTVVMEEMRHVESVAVGIWVKAGAVDEDQNVSGISHFIEHMIFKGTTKRDAFHLSYDIEKIGGQSNAFTGKEATCYYVKATKDNIFKACDVICDMVEDPLFDIHEMTRERKVIEEEIKMGEDDPEDKAHDILADGLFKGTPLGNSIIGTATSIGRVSQAKMRAYYEAQYVRDSIVVSVAGNFDAEKIAEYFEERFSGLAKTKKKRAESRPDAAPFASSIVRDIKQAHIFLGKRAIKKDDDRSYAFMVMNNILGGGMSSRLFQGVREKKGLAYTVYSGFSSYRDSGFFEIYAGVAEHKVRKALVSICDELKRLADETVSEEELESSIEQMKASYVYSSENPTSRMVINGKNYLLIGKVYDPKEVMEGFSNVSPSDIDNIKGMISDTSEHSLVIAAGRRIDAKSLRGSVL